MLWAAYTTGGCFGGAYVRVAWLNAKVVEASAFVVFYLILLLLKKSPNEYTVHNTCIVTTVDFPFAMEYAYVYVVVYWCAFFIK